MQQTRESIVAEHDDGDVDTVVGDENSGKCALWFVAQHLYLTVLVFLTVFQFADVFRGKREKGNL